MNTNYLLNSSPLSAHENAETLRRTQRAMTESFIDASVAVFWMRHLKQYKELGFSRMETFLESQGIDISKAQFHDMARLGNALRWVNVTRDELLAVGYSSAKEIARLAQSAGDAEIMKEDIARLITRRAKGLMSNKDVIAEVDILLNGSKAGKSDNPAADNGDDSGDDTATTAADWRTKYKSLLGSATDEADFIARIREMLGE
jgi:hypothetical protein